MRQLAIFILLLLSGCQHTKQWWTDKIDDSHDGAKLGKAYCDCLRENAGMTDYHLAQIICDGEFVKKNKYFRAYRFNIFEMASEPLLEYDTISKVSWRKYDLFGKGFNDYMSTNCSYSTFKCMQDSAYRERTSFRFPRHHAFAFLRGIETCKEAEELASKHFKEGDYKIVLWGLLESRDPDFDDFYYLYIRKKYRINVIPGGCVKFETGTCYGDKMLELIYAKYGNPPHRIFEQEAREAYRKI